MYAWGVMSIAASLRTGPFIEDEDSFEFSKYKNLLKSKCNKSLKKKLKKYKLRKDGQEDPEVLDVSQSFGLSLKLRSPTQPTAVDANDNLDCDEFKYPKNYIIKMVRRKQAILTNHVDKELKTDAVSVSQESPESINMKQTNAFKLLMESRNKSIGSNSPGKERVIEPESDESFSKKTMKAKRNLALQKMAESKGSLKKKEIEKLQDECIKKKMDKRAERLKKMITKGKRKKSTNVIESIAYDFENESSSDMGLGSNASKIAQDAKIKILKEVIDKREMKKDYKIENKTNIDLTTTLLCQDDNDFLKKLSPSLKKKENMLCYFQKVDKQYDSVGLSDHEGQEKDDQLIKVKIITKNKRKIKKKRLSLRKANENEVFDNEFDNEKTSEQKDMSDVKNEIKNHIDSSVNNKITRKRKRQETNSNLEVNIISPNDLRVSEGRPKRSIKIPVKYIDDIKLSSSDEESLITPKKKKLINTIKTKDSKTLNLSTKGNKEKVIKHENSIISKTSSKLAPIFVGKCQVDMAALEAKQKFLHSGIPDKLKKLIAHQKNQAVIADSFYPVVHVQQMDTTPMTIINSKLFDESKIEPDDEYPVHLELDFHEIFSKNMLYLYNKDEDNKVELNETTPFKQNDINSILHHIKGNYPEFPVYRTFKTLISKFKDDKEFKSVNPNNSVEVLNDAVDPRNDNPDNLSWTDKYKAKSSKHIIGNFESHAELKKWLISCTEKYASSRMCNEDSDSDFWNSDTDSRENMRFSNNLLVLTGATGSGKTAAVYAVATELAIKVIEVNVSSRRTGKILLQDLQEATQSHKVNRGKGSGSENSQELVGTKSLHRKYLKNNLKKTSKLPVPQKSDSLSQNSQEEGHTVLSLILIDDADIVFEQDDGFVSAIAQLIQSSKRPVILITTSLSSPHLQRFLLCGNVIKMNSLSPKMLGTWLDIMCLADTGMCWPGTGAKFLNFFQGDMRKSINSLHFYVFSETQKRSLGNNSDDAKKSICDELEDENSNMSWAGKYISESSKEITANYNFVHSGIWRHFIRNSTNEMHMSRPESLLNIWWSIPSMVVNDAVLEKENTGVNDLETISDIYDSVSIADCISFKIRPDFGSDFCADPWHCPETHSVSEKESLDEANNFSETSYSICQELIVNNINKLKKRYKFEDFKLNFHGLIEQRKRYKIISRHETLYNAINPSSMLDRRAIALDYWPTCRNICRTEKGRTDKNSKRNNRFFHYLKSAKVLCKNEIFEKLCDSLKPSEES